MYLKRSVCGIYSFKSPKETNEIIGNRPGFMATEESIRHYNANILRIVSFGSITVQKWEEVNTDYFLLYHDNRIKLYMIDKGYSNSFY